MKTDKDLVLEFQSGNPKALNQLVRHWHKPFCEKAYWLVKDADAAKDIAQDSWRVIINKIDKLEKPESFGSWGLRIVCNKSIDWLNKNSRIRKHLEQIKQEQSKQIDIEEPQNNVTLKAKLLDAFKMLPSHQQTVIKLFYTEDYSLKEISETLNISVGTAKSRLFHAREKLKQLLKNYNYED
ncbi:sigma-70 family RNA polymerase sigma factor [Hyunsoonleella flava]|uniref:Sigma-70 family RNA polymerase sigma factor n=1 Tax=Hyunsoonleella flava TaxID=2527939 RepID=A0A4Q9FK47_9FLAO|nr:sigma-70 family RNA polymerase sigma factor [Hyunsoonleella flava]TBN06774.1 sigma-70 family RNA polymerase sigma factor [Hyunsoonleella flava]